MPKKINWDEIRAAYVQNAYTYAELSQIFGVHVQSITTRAAKEKWRDDRDAFRERVSNEAEKKEVARAARDQAETLAALRGAHSHLVQAAAELATDAEQFRRHIISVKSGHEEYTEETIFKKGDARALKDIVNALDSLLGMHERLYGTRDDTGGGVIVLPERDDQ